MFDHDRLLTDPEERRRFHAAYAELAKAVSESLRMYTYLVDEFRRRANADGSDHHAVPLLLMFEFAEAIDGVVLLAERGSARNCSQLLRTAFEVQLGLRYVLDNKDDYRRRVLAYEFFHKRSNLRWAEKCDPDTPVGKQLRAELVGDILPDLFEATGRQSGAKKEAERGRVALNSPRYAEVRAEIDRIKAEKKRSGKDGKPVEGSVNNWFSLWSGPRTIRDLAKHLKVLSAYEALYCAWSSVTHGEAAIKRIKGRNENGLANLQPVRSPEGLPSVCQNAYVLCNGLTFFVLRSIFQHRDDPIIKATHDHYERLVKPYREMLVRSARENTVSFRSAKDDG